MSDNKVYLGDSVYAVYDNRGGVILTVENGLPEDPSHVIYLEPEVYGALVNFVTRKVNKEKFKPGSICSECTSSCNDPSRPCGEKGIAYSKTSFKDCECEHCRYSVEHEDEDKWADDMKCVCGRTKKDLIEMEKDYWKIHEEHQEL